MVGNVEYRAPKLSGRNMLTIKRYPLMIDAFSFGKTSFEVLSGEVLFKINGEKQRSNQR
jgi:hypothetical protein